jgi:putative flippase GtrA
LRAAKPEYLRPTGLLRNLRLLPACTRSLKLLVSHSLKSATAEFGRLFWFGVTGGAAFAAYSAAMWVVTSCGGLGQVPGAFAGFTVGTIVSFIGNSSWVFQRKPTARNVVTFWIVTMFGLVVNLMLAYLLERLKFRPFNTVIIIFVTVPILNYIGHRFWTFRVSSATAENDFERRC